LGEVNGFANKFHVAVTCCEMIAARSACEAFMIGKDDKRENQIKKTPQK
jgi:hypothetical protein